MNISFHKYQGTGNDFVMIDDRNGTFPSDNISLIAHLCDRKMGVGADGVILIQKHPSLDFRMVYFNPDGSKSLCGNGSRCAIAFAHTLGIIGNHTTFETTDGIHTGSLSNGLVYFQLHDVHSVEPQGSNWYINTGSPHHIQVVTDVDGTDIVNIGKAIRYSEQYSPAGTNVNFLEKTPQGIKVRTYERGVENETLSCGTGVTACALAASFMNYESPVTVDTRGGRLTVSFRKNGAHFEEIYLAGPAKKVFEGIVEVPV